MSDPKFPPPSDKDADTKHPPPDRVEKQQQASPQNDRAASNQSGMGSNSGQRDMTSGRHSGNQ